MMDHAGAHLNRILELDEAHPEALVMRVIFLEAEGNEKRANWYRRRLEFAPESAWHIIGPFPNLDGGGFDTAYPPEIVGHKLFSHNGSQYKPVVFE